MYCCICVFNKATFTISSKVFLESSTAKMYFDFGLSSMMFWSTLEKGTQFSPAVIISNKLYMQKYSELIITLQGHIHESRGCNLCPVQTEELLETASTKTPVGKIQRHFTRDDFANWPFRIYTQSILSYRLSHSYLPWKSSERGFLLCRTEDHTLQHSP